MALFFVCLFVGCFLFSVNFRKTFRPLELLLTTNSRSAVILGGFVGLNRRGLSRTCFLPHGKLKG